MNDFFSLILIVIAIALFGKYYLKTKRDDASKQYNIDWDYINNISYKIESESSPTIKVFCNYSDSPFWFRKNKKQEVVNFWEDLVNKDQGFSLNNIDYQITDINYRYKMKNSQSNSGYMGILITGFPVSIIQNQTTISGNINHFSKSNVVYNDNSVHSFENIVQNEYYKDFINNQSISEKDIDKIENYLQELIKNKLNEKNKIDLIATIANYSTIVSSAIPLISFLKSLF